MYVRVYNGERRLSLPWTTSVRSGVAVVGNIVQATCYREGPRRAATRNDKLQRHFETCGTVDDGNGRVVVLYDKTVDMRHYVALF